MLTDIRALADHFLTALPNINTFLKKFFPAGKTSALRGKISSFQQ